MTAPVPLSWGHVHSDRHIGRIQGRYIGRNLLTAPGRSDAPEISILGTEYSLFVNGAVASRFGGSQALQIQQELRAGGSDTELVQLVGSGKEIPVTGMVLAPFEYYMSPGKKRNAVKSALMLIERFTSQFDIDVRSAVWNESCREIGSFQPLFPNR